MKLVKWLCILQNLNVTFMKKTEELFLYSIFASSVAGSEDVTRLFYF